MHSVLKTMTGGALAVLLAVSATPAMAYDELPTNPEETTVVDPAEETTGTEEGAGNETADPEATEPPTEELPGDEVPAEEDPAAEEAPAAEEPEVTVEEVDEVEPVEEVKEFTEVPDTIALNGRVIVLPNEPSTDAALRSIEDGPAAADDGAAQSSGALIMTDDGSFVRVDEASFGESLIPDAQFSGTAVLGDAAREAVSQSLEAEGSLSATEVLEAVTESAEETHEALAVSGQVSEELPDSGAAAGDGTPLGGAPSKKTHTADVVYFKNSGSSSYNDRTFSESSLKSLVSQTGTYWKGQSNGAVAGLKVKKYKKLKAKWTPCYQDGLWDQASKAFGANSKTYTGGHHLIVFVDSSYGCSMAGLAGISKSIHSGGVIWVDIASWSGTGTSTTQGTLNKSLSTLAHEFGHNASLGHAQSRVCSGKTVDARTAWKDDEQNKGVLRVKKPTGTKCKDVEYGDTWNLMGTSRANSKPSSVGIAQRAALGVTASGSLKKVYAKNGRKQSFTLNSVGSNSGLRGLKISNLRGESFYVEYRAASGQDSQVLGGSSAIYSVDGTTAVTSGVLVTKGYPKALIRQSGTWKSYPAKRSTGITDYRTAGSYPNMKHLTLINSGSTTPIDSIARVRVASISGGKAKVTVEFTPFIDVAYNHKYYKQIGWMKSAGLSNGVSAGKGMRKYKPYSDMSRQAMAAFLYRLNTPKGKTAPTGYTVPKKSPFKDVSTKHKYYKQIAWMYKSGLSKGIKTKTGRIYAPSSGVTRSAMAVFLYRMQGATYGGAATSPFADVRKSNKYYKQISWMYATGLSKGTKQKSGKPKYMPKSDVSRQAMAAFIYRLKH